MKVVNNWDVATNVLPENKSLGYLAPECLWLRLTGTQPGRGRIITSEIKALRLGRVKTLSGSVYALGTPRNEGSRARLLYALDKLGRN